MAEYATGDGYIAALIAAQRRPRDREDRMPHATQPNHRQRRRHPRRCHAKSGPDEKWTAEKSGPPSEKWTGCSFISLARLWGIKSIN